MAAITTLVSLGDVIDSYFDGQSWNPDAVIGAQRRRAEERAREHRREFEHSSLLVEPVPESLVSEFERLHYCTLPVEYRTFLIQVGDGGDGPGLDMRQLGAPFDDRIRWERGEFHGGPHEPNLQLGMPFPLVDAQPATPEFKAALESDSFPEEFIVELADDEPLGYPGALCLFSQGAGMWDLLIVNGSNAGEMWADRGADGLGCSPILYDGRRAGFADHYCAWLDM